MSSSFKIDSDSFQQAFMQNLDAALKEACEPIVQEAVKKCEEEIREQIAVKSIRLREFINYQMQENQVVITVEIPHKDS